MNAPLSPQDRWTAVDGYIANLLIPADPALDAALAASDAAGLPPHHISPAQGRLLVLLAQMQGARRILEIGTLGGYSTIWLARALPANGHLITLEVEPRHAEVAQANIARAGLADRVELHQGRAVDSLARLAAETTEPFDFIFIDADKPSNPEYLTFALKLARPGGVIIVDNVVRNGAVLGAEGDANVRGIRRMNEMVAANPTLTATIIQTVGCKGYDGFALIRVAG